MRISFKTSIAFVLTIAVALSNWFMVYSFADEYTLQQNEVAGIYKDIYGNYNCYAFAIGRGEDEKQYKLVNKHYNPGDISGVNCDIGTVTIEDIANAVVSDLRSIGFTVSLPSYNQIPNGFDQDNPNQQLICLRLGYNTDGARDFHFMRYDAEMDCWYHKPGGTAILKYVGSSLQDDWIGECYSDDNSGLTGYIYTGTIAYILYDTNSIEVDSVAPVQKAIVPNKDIFAKINVSQADEYVLKITSYHAIDYELYKVDHTQLDRNLVVISHGADKTSVSTTIDMTVGIYFLRMNFTRDDLEYDNAGYNNPHYNVSVWVHSHDLGDWESLDNMSHERTCPCGFFEVQTHSYPSWIYYNNFVHKKTCICGYSITESHYVRRSDIVDGRYANCLSCLRRLDLNVDHAGIIMSNVVKVSANGSYILASGVVVLVDADVEAYLNGTLVFNEQVNVPPTSDV